MTNSTSYKFPKQLILASVLAAFSLATSSVQAEYLGLPSGRSGDLSKMPDMSIEGGYVAGESFNSDYTLLGIRFNYKLDPKILIYGDLGKVEVGTLDDTAFGIGMFYQLQNFVEFGETSFKASFHKANLSRFGSTNNLDQNILSAELVFGGREPISDNGMRWYANAGIHHVSGDRDSEIDAGFGGGVVLPLGPGEAFFGIDHIDELTFGGGFRYAIR